MNSAVIICIKYVMEMCFILIYILNMLLITNDYRNLWCSTSLIDFHVLSLLLVVFHAIGDEENILRKYFII